MVRVQPARIFGGLAQLFWIRTIVHNPIVHRRATGIVCRPPDNRQMLLRQLDLWPLADLYARGFWSRWTFLSEQAAAQDHDRQCQQHFIHIHTSKRINSEWLEAKKPRSPPSAVSGSGSSARIRGFARRTSQRRDVIGFELSPFRVLPYGIGGLGKGGTPQTADAQGGRGGVGIRKLLPCLDGEQLGSVAGLQVMQTPVKVLMSG